MTEIPAANPNSPIVYSGSDYLFNAPGSIAADKLGNIWVANYQGNSVTELVKVKN